MRNWLQLPCFPFSVHHIDKQGYIDGGYYDNLPISLALKMGADKIIAIELNQDATHDYFSIVLISYLFVLAMILADFLILVAKCLIGGLTWLSRYFKNLTS